MGTSVPAEPLWGPGTAPGEKALWRWAVDQLPDSVRVLPQVAMTVAGRGATEEAEIDLVLLDPDGGVTAVEVKSGTISYDGRRARWLQNGHECRDPVQQVKRARSLLNKVLKAAGVDPAAVAVRWAVATPETRLTAPGEPILDDAQLWDALAAEKLGTYHARTTGQLTLGEEPLGDDRADYLARHLRGRTREGRPSLVAVVSEHEEQVRVQTDSHRNVLAHFAANKHVLVRGAAGTGKTVLALEAAARAAAFGERVLLVCWNIVLASWMRAELRRQLQTIGSPVASQVTAEATGKVVVSHAVGLARQSSAAPPDDVEEAELYKEWMPAQLHPGVTDGAFDLVVLDEAQDLSEPWVWAISDLVRKGGRWYAFTDRQQDLFHSDAALPDFLEVEHPLSENFRNSRQIAEFVSQFGEIELDCLTGDGPPVRYVRCAADRVVARTDEVAKKLLRDERFAESDVAVLWLFNNPHRRHTDEVAEQALAGGLVRTNGASFKGMERPVIVLGLDMDPSKGHRAEECRRSIYAAATRARSHLVVVGDPDVADAYGFEDLATSLRDPDVTGS